MNRRQFLGLVGVSTLGASGGCLAGQTDGAGASTSARSDAGLTAEITGLDEAGTTANEEVNGTFDCEAGTGVVTGNLSTSSCRKVVVRSVSVDEDTDEGRIVLYPEWDNPGSPENTDCAGMTYEYEIQLSTRDSLPGEIIVVYERAEVDDTETFTLSTEC